RHLVDLLTDPAEALPCTCGQRQTRALFEWAENLELPCRYQKLHSKQPLFAFCSMVLDWARDGRTRGNVLVFHGGPGCGKSWWLAIIKGIVGERCYTIPSSHTNYPWVPLAS
ncbi:unnamed protein product, partial [Amoebophrya sp. A25]